MTTHRFFVSANQIRGQQVTLSGEQARQIYNVLRLRRGDSLVVLDNQGWIYGVEIWTAARDNVVGQILSKAAAPGEARTRLTLYQSMLKGDKFDWVLQKGTELGVSAFVPMITRRTILRQEKIKPNKLKRWQRIVTEAGEQSGRGRIPIIKQPQPFDTLLAAINNFDCGLIGWVGEEQRDIAGVLATLPPDSARVALFIGPEGGFAEEEIEAAEQAGVHLVTLGPRILRAETAAIVATTIIMQQLGDLR